MRWRSRIVALTVLRISDRLPPVSRLMSMAATTHSRSLLSMRWARARMRLGQVTAEACLDQHVGELAAGRLLGLLGHRVERLGDAVAAAQRVVTSWSTSGNWSANAAWRLALVRLT